MLHKGAEIRRPVYQWNTQLTEKKRKVLFISLLLLCVII